MNKIEEIISNIQIENITTIIIAVLIILIFKLLGTLFSTIIIKVAKINKKGKLKIQENPFFKPLKSFFTLLGTYLALLYINENIGLNENILNISKQIFRIFVILIIANGFSNSLTSKSSFINKLAVKMNKENDNQTIKFLVGIIKFVIYIFAIFMIITELGYDISGLVTGLGIGSVVITLAAQDTAKNLLGGFAIFLDKPFKVGDYIKISTYEGTVENISYRSTRIRTLDNSVLHIPNSEISIQYIDNCGEIQKRRYKTNLILDNNTELFKIENAKNKIIEFLKENDKIDQGSEIVKMQNILNTGLELVVIAYISNVNYAEFLSYKETINYRILQILKEENIRFAENIQTVFVKK